MAISKVKLPDNSVQDIKDSRLPSAASGDNGKVLGVTDANGTLGWVEQHTVPTISTDIVSDKASDTKTASPKAVYDHVHPAIQTTQPSGGFLPNVMYNLGTLTGTVSFSLATPISGIVNHYYWTFSTGSTAPTITWPSGITGWNNGLAPSISANSYYEISVFNGIGCYIAV